ncbi:hypothetical protein BDP81DRAFT_104246 [Colletotrichum phormii]|uniref:Uncharacterized protein n=1 Tax=Colletotrichum phormii TaxID=359342 RepID=A0AAI9ZKL8_9PEZI|nr:uncharacterized protein BDP81DRAFT_104246 [Colletotrichum phormii]KAK1624999.1 hypothetical protein BDP81DRAFT_104246 [Colletotrichum phormii]
MPVVEVHVIQSHSPLAVEILSIEYGGLDVLGEQQRESVSGALDLVAVIRVFSTGHLVISLCRLCTSHTSTAAHPCCETCLLQVNIRKPFEPHGLLGGYRIRELSWVRSVAESGSLRSEELRARDVKRILNNKGMSLLCPSFLPLGYESLPTQACLSRDRVGL